MSKRDILRCHKLQGNLCGDFSLLRPPWRHFSAGNEKISLCHELQVPPPQNTLFFLIVKFWGIMIL